MTTLERELQTILDHLARLRRHDVNLLQDPLTPEEIRFRLLDVQLHPTDELMDLYSWRNGTRAVQGDILDDLHFFPGFYFMSLDKAIHAYHTWTRDEWNPAWFPVFANGGGDFYVVQLSRNVMKQSEVVCFLRGEPEQQIAFESLLSMARTISACYDAGVYYLDAGGYLEVNYEAVAAVATKFNPTLDRYKS